MYRKISLLIVLTTALIFTIVFKGQNIGINLLLFETLVLTILIWHLPFNLKQINLAVTFTGTLLSLASVVINNSVMAIVMNIFSFMLLIGVVMAPNIRSLVYSATQSFLNLFMSFGVFFSELGRQPRWIRRSFKFLFKARFFILPVLIFLLFVWLYGLSNPVFQNYADQVFVSISDFFVHLFSFVSWSTLGVFILGLVVSIYLYRHKSDEKLEEIDGKSTMALLRKRKSYKGKILGLNKELLSGVFLLIILNALILLANTLDIYWVWFNFEWEGQYLKQFVHTGTYTLIMSILISMGIGLYFFRKNLNFHSGNKWIKILCIAWLAQNGIMILSVGMRSYWYIHHFALAYKRIGVIFFLAAALIGIITIIYKVHKRRSLYYLLRINALSIYIILISVAIINWDVIITKYNIANHKQSFVHFDYLATLSNGSLPYLNFTLEELKAIESVQDNLFDFRHRYMTAEEFYERIEERKKEFVENFEKRHWLSWNLADQQAYNALKSNDLTASD